jgi:hypothetical protein
LTSGAIPIRLKAVKGNRLRRWMGALLIAPVLAVAVSASSFSGLRCSMTGLFVPESCCPSAAQSVPPAVPSPLAAIGDPSCCLRVVVAMDKIPAAGALRATPGLPLVAFLSDPSPVPTLQLAAGRPAAAGAWATKPPGGPPIFLLTRSILI